MWVGCRLPIMAFNPLSRNLGEMRITMDESLNRANKVITKSGEFDKARPIIWPLVIPDFSRSSASRSANV